MGESVKVVGGGGKWVLKGGRFWDTERGAWIVKCVMCKSLFYAYRSDVKTCGDTCRQRLSRKSRAV